MKKAASFLTKHRYIIASVMIVLTIVCVALAFTVPINRDRTKYLADESRMKQGLAIMESSFPEAEEKSSVRVMFDNLDAEQIPEIRARLEAIPYVSSVQYEADSEEYNRGPHTLFVVNSTYAYGTAEEKSVEAAIGSGFAGYTVAYKNNDIPVTDVPLWIILVALALAVLVLIAMSHSWLDPLLFLITTGVAVALNAGTNIVLPYVDEMTATIGPVLQLVLSMDYSIILMNRFRLEKQSGVPRTEAMKAAIAGSFSSVSSSALTTAAGLLALLFLSFKLGPEMGIVLAKGVLISMVCVFTVLPVLILAADPLLDRTAKNAPRIPLGPVCRFSYRARHILPVVFAVLLVGSFFLQGHTKINYTEENGDPLAGVFPRENTIVLLYRSEDEEQAVPVISELEKDGKVRSVLGYPNTLGKPLSAAEMAEALGSMGGEMQVSADQVSMVYLYYGTMNHAGAETGMTIPQFVGFLCDDMLNNELYSGLLDEKTKADLFDGRAALDSAAAQMKGDEWSRIVITSDYPDESPETQAFVDRINELCGSSFGEYYLIGTSVMADEMDKTFQTEHLMIALITAVAVFLVVLITFRNPVLPLLLTLVVLCGVFITTAVISSFGGGIFYLALLIMQSILMGATIDYGIVFSNLYTENRKTSGVTEALAASYEGSIHTIMTSGSILVLVLAALGAFAPSVSVSEVSITLSCGVLIAMLLILFILPGMFACADRLICKKR